LYTDDAYLWKANWQEKVAINTNLNFKYGLDTNIDKYQITSVIDDNK